MSDSSSEATAPSLTPLHALASASPPAPVQAPAHDPPMAGTQDEPRMKHFPVAFFAMVMGLTGLSIAWHKAELTFGMTMDVHFDAANLKLAAQGIHLNVSSSILALAATAFVVLLLLYSYKVLRWRGAVVKELGHPIQLNFFPTVSISLILLSIAALSYSPDIARPLWMVGTGVHLLLTLYVMSVWIHHEHFEIHHINPAWFIPVVGNVLVPVAGVPLGYAELSWFFFSIGVVFWIVLFTIIMYRVLFHHPLQERLMPTFFILIAPPAVGFISYMQLTGSLDSFARVLYYMGLFLTLLLATQIGRFVRIRYYLSWWAYSFPLAAITIASLLMFETTRDSVFAAVAGVLLAVVTLVVLYLLYRTFREIGSKGICVPVHH